MRNNAPTNNVTPITSARKAKPKSGYKRLSLNKHDKLDDALKAARDEVERIKRIVARHSDQGDTTVAKLDRFWEQFEAVRWDLIERGGRDHSKKDQVMHSARKYDGGAS